MDSDESGTEIVKRNTTDLLPHDAKEVETVSQYAKKQEHKMKKLTDDVNSMGKLKLIWDSKVPEMNKKLYHFLSLQESDREKIKNHIQNYLEFYQQMKEVVTKLRSGEETENEKDVYSIILDLYESLTKLVNEAETGKKTTGSSIVCSLHRNFISKHEKLENMIKRVECVSLKQSWKKATAGLQQSLKAIDNLRSDLQASEAKYDNMCDKFDELLVLNKRLVKQQNFLLEENAKIMQQQEILLEDNKNMKQQTDILINIIATVAKEKEKSNKDKSPNVDNTSS